jgi:hypothetical protein
MKNLFDWRAALAYLCVFLICPAAPLAAQNDHADEHHFHHNHVAVFVGGTTALNEEKGGTTSFTVGADYERRVTATLGVMAVADLSIGNHKRQWLAAAMFAYRPLDELRLAIGPGLELVDTDETSGGTTITKTKAYFVVSSRASYEFHVGKLSLSPTLGLDFIGETKTSFVYGLAVGYGF